MEIGDNMGLVLNISKYEVIAHAGAVISDPTAQVVPQDRHC